LQSFDSKKYGKVFDRLCERHGLTLENCFQPEGPVRTEDLLKVHTRKYLYSLKWSYKVARIADITLLAFIPNSFLQSRILYPMRLATAGTVLAARLALKRGWAINLSGIFYNNTYTIAIED
jgi:histone deacetylase 11